MRLDKTGHANLVRKAGEVNQDKQAASKTFTNTLLQRSREKGFARMLTPEKIAASGSEHAMQVALFMAISQPEIQAKYPELMLAFAIPNGGKRDARTAAMLKAEGVKAGVWDIFLPVTSGPKSELPNYGVYRGLWVEMKAGKNKTTPEQRDFYYALQPYQFDWFVAYTWREAFDKMIAYLGPR
jgi:hypothetical protein